MSNHKSKTHCIHGHDIAIVGRIKHQGECRECYRIRCLDPIKANWSRIGGWKADGILNESGAFFSINDFNRLFQIQGGRCKLCEKHQSEFDRNLCVDHDVETGYARGLLCMLCNRNMVGKHTLETAMKLVAYLKNNLSKVQTGDPTGANGEDSGYRDPTGAKILPEAGPSKEGNSVRKVNPNGFSGNCRDQP